MWGWSRSVAEHAAAAAFTRPVTEPEPKDTEAEPSAESAFTAEATEGEIGDGHAMRPADFDLAG